MSSLQIGNKHDAHWGIRICTDSETPLHSDMIAKSNIEISKRNLSQSFAFFQTDKCQVEKSRARASESLEKCWHLSCASHVLDFKSQCKPRHLMAAEQAIQSLVMAVQLHHYESKRSGTARRCGAETKDGSAVFGAALQRECILSSLRSKPLRFRSCSTPTVPVHFQIQVS